MKKKRKNKLSFVDVDTKPEPGGSIPINKKYRGGKRRALNTPDWIGDAEKKGAESFKPFAEVVKSPGATMLMESMFESDPDKCPVWTDPQTRKEVHARVIGVKWLERGIDDKGRECVRHVTYSPDKFLEVWKNTKKNLRESAKNNNLSEAVRHTFERLSEQFEGEGDWPSLPGSSGFGGGEWLPFPPGPLTRNIYLNDQWEMIAQSHQLYNYNATAHGATNMLAAFVVGDGVSVKSEDDEVQDVVDEFINRVKFQPRLFTQSVMLSKNGELLWHTPEVQVGMKQGYVDFISKDPGTCWEILTNLNDERDVKAYYFNYPTRYLLISKDGLPVSDYIIEFIDPKEMIHIKVNVEENEARGRSDLLSIQPLLKMVYDNLRYRNIKVINAAGLIIDRQIKGDNTDVNNIASIQTGFTGAGTEYTHNESEKIDVIKGAESESSKSGLFDESLSQVGTGFGEPSDYLGSGGSGSRGAALTRTEPAAKLFLSRQIVFETPMKDVFKRVIQVAKKYGRLKADSPEEVEISFPEVAPENVKDKIGTLSIALQTRAISHEEFVGLVRNELKINKTYDYDELQAQINKEKQGQLASLYQSPTVDPDTGTLTDSPLGSGAVPPKGPAGTNQQPQNVKGKNQSKKAYDGKMALTNQDRNSIKKQLQSIREAKHEGKKGKSQHSRIHKGLRSRTKHTVAEAALGPMARLGADNLESYNWTKEAEELIGSPHFEALSQQVLEVTPKGFPDDVKSKILDFYDDPSIAYPVMWAIRGKGYA